MKLICIKSGINNHERSLYTVLVMVRPHHDLTIPPNPMPDASVNNFMSSDTVSRGSKNSDIPFHLSDPMNTHVTNLKGTKLKGPNALAWKIYILTLLTVCSPHAPFEL